MNKRVSNARLKITMAVTGAIFAAFVLVHMIGNLKVYTGAEHFDGYAHWLRAAFEPLLPHEGLLWILRFVLGTSLLLHLWAGWLVRARGRRARGRVRRRPTTLRSWAANSMPATGLVLLAFLVFHLLDLTVGTRPVAPDAFKAGSAHANVVASFSRWPVAAVYIAAMVGLCAHLAHGLVSVVLDLGAGGRRSRKLLAALALAVGLVVAVGNTTIPIAVLAGVVK